MQKLTGAGRSKAGHDFYRMLKLRRESAEKRKKKRPPEPAASWKAVYHLEANAFRVDQKRDRREQSEKVVHMKEVLDRQLVEKAEAQRVLRREQLDFAEEINADARRLRKELKTQKKEARKDGQRQVDERIRTEAVLAERAAARRQRRIDIELASTRACKAAIRLERKLQAEKKEMQKQANKKMFAENEARLKEKERARQQRMREEVRMNKEYEESLAQKDRERKEFLKQQQEKQKALLERSLNYYAENIKEKELEDERKARAVQAEHERKEKEKHAQMLERRERQKKQIKMQIEAQMKRNSERMEARRMEGIKLARKQREEYARSLAEDYKKQQAAEEARLRYKEELLQQAEKDKRRREHALRYGNIEMSKFEEKLNKEFLHTKAEKLPRTRNILRVVG